MKTRKSGPPKGITLIELLVCIAIIAILAAILFPVFANTRNSARQITCVSYSRQLGVALYSYAQDWDETLPLPWSLDPNTNIQNHWQKACLPYTTTYQILYCPQVHPRRFGYGLNFLLARNVTLAQIRESSGQVLVAEVISQVDRVLPEGCKVMGPIGWDGRFQADLRHPNPTRKQSGVIILFCDTHVKWQPRNHLTSVASVENPIDCQPLDPQNGPLNGTFWWPE